MANALIPQRARNALMDVAQGASNSAASAVSFPVDAIAWLLKRAGVNVGTPVGGSDWMAQKGLTRPTNGSTAGYIGEALGGVAPMVAAAKAPQVANALIKAGDNLANAQRIPMSSQRGAIVWHGSPHKFDKFDSSKIGTGEGAQAYGHGLYLAESPVVARGYMNALSPGAGVGDADTVARVFKMNGGDPVKAAADLERRAQYANIPGGKEKLLELAAKVRAGYDPTGALYKVDLPDSAISRMLDWDKPLSQQAPEVLQVLQAADRRAKDSLYQNGGEYYRALMSRHAQNAPLHIGLDAAENAAQFPASQQLRALGIPGIRYLDGNSRGAGQGTSNFVVFPGEENLLRILERNGIPVK